MAIISICDYNQALEVLAQCFIADFIMPLFSKEW